MTTPWQIEFYESPDGRVPVLQWLEDLSVTKKRAAAAGLEIVLAADGPAVCGTSWGRNLGQGLFEFRLRHSEHEIANIRGVEATEAKASAHDKILLRFFCHAYGRQVVLLLAAYDKARDPSNKREQREIREARKRLREFRRRRS